MCSREVIVLCIFCQAFRWELKIESQLGALNVHPMSLHIIHQRMKQAWVVIFDSPKPYHSNCCKPLSALWSTYYSKVSFHSVFIHSFISFSFHLCTQDSFGIQWIVSELLIHLKLMRKSQCPNAYRHGAQMRQVSVRWVTLVWKDRPVYCE